MVGDIAPSTSLSLCSLVCCVSWGLDGDTALVVTLVYVFVCLFCALGVGEQCPLAVALLLHFLVCFEPFVGSSGLVFLCGMWQ